MPQDTHTSADAQRRTVSLQAELRVCAETKSWRRKVELWLLNDATNRNDWRYENLEQHRRLFEDTPILVAYVNGKIGDGHNFDEATNPDGTTSTSFMSATAERIVGYFKSEKDIRMEEADGKTWIVGTGYIWRWYAQELVQKLERQGLKGMPVSIETLIDEMHKDGTTEVFTKYQILGTTILGDDVTPAVADASIRALSAIGANNVKQMTLRVASEQKKRAENPQSANKTCKGVKQNMRVKDLEKSFPNSLVLAVDGRNVALLSENGALQFCTADKNGDEIVTGARVDVTANAVITVGEATMEVPVDAITEKLNARIAELTANLEQEKAERQTVTAALDAMQKAEKARREDAVRDAIKSRVAEIVAENDGVISADACDDLLTDERISEFAELVDKDGNFCGNKAAREKVDSLCMDKILAAAKARANAAQNKFSWATFADAANPDADNPFAKTRD